MGHDFRSLFQVETRRLVWVISMVFAVVLVVQYIEFPHRGAISSIFSARKPKVIGYNGFNSSGTDIAYKVDNVTKIPEQKGTGPNDDIESEMDGDLDDSHELDNDADPEDESPSKDIIEHSQNSTVEKTITNNALAPQKRTESEYSSFLNNVPTDNNTTIGSISEKSASLAADKNGSLDAASLSPALPPILSSPNLNTPSNVNKQSQSHMISAHLNTSSADKAIDNIISSGEKSGGLQSDTVLSENRSSRTNISVLKERSKSTTAAVVSISEMNDLLLQSHASSFLVKPRWSSAVDRDLLDAKLHIENAPAIENDPWLYAPLYRNVSVFKRSYELMEHMLKVYIYKEGEKPIFHQPVLKGIYASEGWFMKMLKANKQFVAKNPRKAHLFYLPFSSRMLEETLYVPNSHSRKNLVQHLKDYLDMIAGRYSFWNRTSGADHFLVACHDWAPAETKKIMANCIRALCNADTKEGFILGKDASLPETYVRSAQHPLREVGGKPPSKRQILAFFAGNMHGYLRPILLQHWENKDPDMKIFGPLASKVKKGQMSYVQYMKSSKYCICPKGYEVNSPRVVEAIFYECVPVIISDNFVPPFFETLNWESFAIFVPEKDIPNLKNILLSIPRKRYLEMQGRVKKVQHHFLWHSKAERYDIFHMILHSIWFSRVFQMRSR
ncbi:probable glycosyltransferase At5g03795 isoform X2 [Diospyros lotus]|uniref:probable glycosyltransferase At5g03795 isoform X2 n=1 Tax=Diospyros lotus TaxID=55363 RepID=UPI0022503813|nr:probable glycosyltransferase At5g03795 isoform X2 [Diospyros lotus]